MTRMLFGSSPELWIYLGFTVLFLLVVWWFLCLILWPEREERPAPPAAAGRKSDRQRLDRISRLGDFRRRIQ